MYSLLICFGILIIGYLIYSRITNRVFAPDSRKTPGVAVNDGVDCIPMSKGRTFLIQLLNIAGTGPIFGPLMGAIFGPIVFLWIVFGCILGGAVHDFMVGMISSRHKGASIAELSGIYIGKVIKWIMRVFSLLLLILCGTVFITTPADLLASLTPEWMNRWVWIGIIIAYYFLATVLPIDKIIGKAYPVFGILLIVMAFSVLGGAFAIPQYRENLMNFEIWKASNFFHPEGLPAWPFMFVTVACGAISGFHATQSPMMSKCIQNERQGRLVFYGAMVAEGVIALVWAAVGIAFTGSSQGLFDLINGPGKSAGTAVYAISEGMLGPVGGVLAIVGVVICPITSGDTAFRSARLIIGETFKLDQKKIKNRLFIAIPLFAAGAGLCFVDFSIIWRYFSWSNQTLAMIALWVATFYLLKKGKYKYGSFFTAVPASFMVAVSITYLLLGKETINLIRFGDTGVMIGYIIGGSISVLSFVAFTIYYILYSKKHHRYQPKFFKSFKLDREVRRREMEFLKAELSREKYLVQPNDFSVLVDKKYNFYKKKYSKSIKLAKPRNAKFFKYLYKYQLNFAYKNGIIVSSNSKLNDLLVLYPSNFKGISYFSINGFLVYLKAIFTLNFVWFIRYKNYDENLMLLKESETMNKDYYIYDLVDYKNEGIPELIKTAIAVADYMNRPLFMDCYSSDNMIKFSKYGFKILSSNTLLKRDKELTLFSYIRR